MFGEPKTETKTCRKNRKIQTVWQQIEGGPNGEEVVEEELDQLHLVGVGNAAKGFDAVGELDHRLEVAGGTVHAVLHALDSSHVARGQNVALLGKHLQLLPDVGQTFLLVIGQAKDFLRLVVQDFRLSGVCL